jgi:putative methyltransferase (TIGR04325 family)
MTETQSSNLRRFKRVARAVLPPIIPYAYRRVLAGFGGAERAEWEYLPDGWPEESPSVRGWNSQSVLDTHLATWDDLRATDRSTAPFGLSRGPDGASTVNIGLHNTIVSFGYALARAAGRSTRLSMLDWGGGVGAYYVYARALLPDLDLDYHCRELPLLAEGGKRLLPEATFYADDETALTRHYDFVMASSSIHYLRDWQATLKRLATATNRYMYVTRMPVVQHSPSYVVLQRPYRHGYQTEYPGWFLNREEFLGVAADFGLTLVREFLIAERPDVPNAPEAADYRGFLFSVTGR